MNANTANPIQRLLRNPECLVSTLPPCQPGGTQCTLVTTAPPGASATYTCPGDCSVVAANCDLETGTFVDSLSATLNPLAITVLLLLLGVILALIAGAIGYAISKRRDKMAVQKVATEFATTPAPAISSLAAPSSSIMTSSHGVTASDNHLVPLMVIAPPNGTSAYQAPVFTVAGPSPQLPPAAVGPISQPPTPAVVVTPPVVVKPASTVDELLDVVRTLQQSASSLSTIEHKLIA